MKIFLVRHGDADADVPEGLGDEARALTVKSRQVLVSHFAALTERMGGIDLVRRRKAGARWRHLLGLPSWTKRVHPGTVIGIEKTGDAVSSARLLFYAAPGQKLLESI